MQLDLITRTQNYFDNQWGTSLQQLLQPISPQSPAGHCVKGSGVYHMIETARREDDATLELGPWEHPLKRADWALVSHTATQALLHQSKDLQVAAWLLEAQVQQHGWSALAPALLLINGLLQDYWEELHPPQAGADATHRANILRSVTKKLLPLLKQVPITATDQPRDCALVDWEIAQLNSRIKGGATVAPGVEPAKDAAQLSAVLAATPSAWCQARYLELCNALDALTLLTATLNDCFAEQAPSLSSLTDLLERVLHMLQVELRRRGLEPTLPPMPDTATTCDGAAADAAPAVLPESTAASAPASILPAPTVSRSNPTQDRAQAYALLEHAAQLLQKIEPHSPAPYLVQRAVAWGRLNTAELYQEVFIRLGGQINIFELLGLEAPAQSQEVH